MNVTGAISQVCSYRFHTKQPTNDQGWLLSTEKEIPPRHQWGSKSAPKACSFLLCMSGWPVRSSRLSQPPPSPSTHTSNPPTTRGDFLSAETEIPTRHKLGLQCGPQGILFPRPFKIATLLMGQDEKRAPRLGEVPIFQLVVPPRF